MNIKKTIFLLNLQEWPCPGSHFLHTKKFLKSFIQHGYRFHEISEVEEIDLIRPFDVVYLSNHGFDSDYFPEDIFDKLSQTRAKFILWYWHEYLQIAQDYFGDRFIITGEHFHSEPQIEYHQKIYKIQANLENYLPLTFASYLEPNEIDKLENNHFYLAHFVGAGYKLDINKMLRIRFRKVKILYSPPFITEANRKSIFLSSRVALGWHNESNLLNGVIVERVFEGLSLGNAVISDQKMACVFTDGIVEFADSYDATKDFLLKIKKDKKFLAKKVEAGRAWAKSQGTYYHVSKKFTKILDRV